MHELAIAEQIISAVSAKMACENESTRVTRLVLEIGKLSGVFPDALRFGFEVCVHDTRLEGASLEIIETPGIGRCKSCGRDQETAQPFAVCECGGMDMDWVSGRELAIKFVEVI